MKNLVAFLTFSAVVAQAVGLSGVYTNLKFEDAAASGYIQAPRQTLTPLDSGVERRAIGPAGWMCTKFEYGFSDAAYEKLRGYQNMGNLNGVDMTMVETYPIVEVYFADFGDLCIFLAELEQCYPPRPYTQEIFHINQHYVVEYYGKSFWGQVSLERLLYEVEIFAMVLEDSGVTDMNENAIYLSYYPDHEREIRVDTTAEIVTPAPPPTPFPVADNATTPASSESIAEISGAGDTPVEVDNLGNSTLRTLASRMIKLF